MKTLLILMLALCSLSAGEKTNYFRVVTEQPYQPPEPYFSAFMFWRVETNWADSYWQTEVGTVSSNTYVGITYHHKTTTNLIESAIITNGLTRRYNIKQVRDYSGPFNAHNPTNIAFSNLLMYLK